MRTEHIHQLVKTAESCVEIGALDKATIYFQRVFKLSRPGEFTLELALFRLSHLYRYQHRYVDAIDYIKQALECNPSESRYLLHFAELQLLNGDEEAAASVAYDAARDPMTRADALCILYRIARRRNDESADVISHLLAQPKRLF